MNRFFITLLSIFAFFVLLVMLNELPTCLSKGRLYVSQNEAEQKALEFARERSVKKTLFAGNFEQFTSSPDGHYLTEKIGFWRFQRTKLPTYYKTVVFVVTQADTDRPHGRFIIGTDKCARVRIGNNPNMVGEISLNWFLENLERIEGRNG